jgi:hypothetical protein
MLRNVILEAPARAARAIALISERTCLGASCIIQCPVWNGAPVASGAASRIAARKLSNSGA